MKKSQLWLDTASLLTSGSVYHSTKPDDHFELTERHRNYERVQRGILAQTTRIFFTLGIIAVVL